MLMVPREIVRMLVSFYVAVARAEPATVAALLEFSAPNLIVIFGSTPRS